MSAIINRIKANFRVVLPVGFLLIAGVAYLAFGVFGIHTAFIDDEVNEAGPVFASGAGVSGPPK